jgi:YgiT-type zinc finger domain-containing protein
MAHNTTKNDILRAREAPHLPTPDRCPNCGYEGTLHRETRDELIEVGDNVVIVRVEVDVCEHCGEYVYDLRTVGELEAIEERVRREDLTGFKAVGTVYRQN